MTDMFNKIDFRGLETRTTEDLIPEVNIEGVWLSMEQMQDISAIFPKDKIVEGYREVCGDAVGDWFEKNYYGV